VILSRAVYTDLRDSLVKAQGEANALAQVNAQLNAHIEWMRVRLTQIEFERAQLIKRYMNVDVPTPSFEHPADDRPDMNQVIGFDDIGDEVAAKLGISWGPDGTLQHAK
jgi:hypothetical protein